LFERKVVNGMRIRKTGAESPQSRKKASFISPRMAVWLVILSLFFGLIAIARDAKTTGQAISFVQYAFIAALVLAGGSAAAGRR
jgi:hypothetical protein